MKLTKKQIKILTRAMVLTSEGHLGGIEKVYIPIAIIFFTPLLVIFYVWLIQIGCFK